MSRRKSVFQGAILTVSMRWSDRLIGLVSMVILARLLTPADFGIVAMASIVVGLIDVLLDLGVNIALVHNQNADREDFDTAWTLRLIQACLACSAIFLFAPLAADYYNNPLVIDVLRVMALSIFIAGLENIGIVTFQKNMEFGNDFRFFFYKRVAGFLVTLVAAWLLQTYWAMVIGALAGRMAGVLLSYGMHPHRPRLTLFRLSSIWSFSQWVLLRNVGGYLDSRTDKFLVGGRSSAEVTGTYTVADEIASMPTTELLAPLGRVLFPAFVEKRNNATAFAQSITTAIGVQAMVAIPACIGLAMVAHDAVWLLLGEKWLGAVPFIQILAMANLCIALAHSSGYAMLAIGKVKTLATITWSQTLLFISMAIFLLPQAGAEKLALIRLAVAVAGSSAMIWLALKEIAELKASALFKSLVRPVLASILMALFLKELQPFIEEFDHLWRLLIQVCAGGAVYGTLIVCLWLVARRPVGAEDYVLKNVLQIKSKAP